MNLDYLQILRDSIARPLLRDEAGGIPETLQLMSDYNLTKDDVDNVMEMALWPGGKDVYAAIDSKVRGMRHRRFLSAFISVSKIFR